jgi:hypothetical protein
MRSLCVIALIAIIVAVASPISIHIVPSQKEVVLVTLDVCNGAGPAFSVNGQTTGVCLDVHHVPTPELAGTIDTPDPYFLIRIFSFRMDHPPRV